MDNVAGLGTLIVAAETLLLRDEAGTEHRVTVADDGSFSVGDLAFRVEAGNDGSLRVEGPSRALAWTAAEGDVRWVFVDGHAYTFEIENAGSRRRTAAHHGSLMAPMPATVRKIAVGTGDAVQRGDILIVLEAMKMELPVRAIADGTVTALHCREGELVQPGISLIEID